MGTLSEEQKLVCALARVIYVNDLRRRHGEDTIGVLMKCGAFHEHPSGNIVDLAVKVDAMAETLGLKKNV